MVRIDFNKLRFLVIDDNAHMRRILRTLLHGFGARDVYEAEDGGAGLEAFTHYVGPERRKGGKADVLRQTPLLDKAKIAG
jgi:CheY-like chemotaxis protein